MTSSRCTLDTTIRERLLEVWERTGDEGLQRLADGQAYDVAATTDPAGGCGAPLSQPEWLDWARTGLMNVFRITGDCGAFDLLHDLSRDSFLAAIRGRLRGQPVYVDAHDVLQEVFLNIYRYPHRFLPERADAFRNWGHRIVRNTLLKTLKGASRHARVGALEDELVECPDSGARSPLRHAADAESAQVADRAFLLWLNLYLLHFDKLSAREQRALRRVECDGRSYKETADELGIRLENLKMVIFRGRRKILRGMSRSLGRLREHFDRTAADLANPSGPDGGPEPSGAADLPPRRRRSGAVRAPLAPTSPPSFLCDPSLR